MGIQQPSRIIPFRRRLLALSIATVLCIIPITQASAAAEVGPTGPTDPKEVQAFADSFFNRPEVKEKLTGALFVVVKDDKVLLNKGYGYADLEKKLLIDPDKTVFRMASVSKVFTATGIMQLVEEGKVDLNADIGTYTGDIQIANQTSSPLTVEHLLTHTTGFDYSDFPEVGTPDLKTLFPLEQYIKQFQPTVIRKPGSSYKYDNMAAALQGYIVQQVSGMPFAQYMEERILIPLGMENSDFLLTPQINANLAKGYNPKHEPYPMYANMPTEAPEGGLYSTGSDMAKFMLAHLNGGQFGSNRILNNDTSVLMKQVHAGINEELPNMMYGFESFFQDHHNGQNLIGKAGDMPGHHTWMWLLPEHKVGGLIIVNDDAFDYMPLFVSFMDHYYPKKNDQRVEIALTKEQLSRFEGTFRDLRIPLWTTQVSAGDGFLTIQDPYGSHKLKPIGDLLFQDDTSKLAAFKEDDTGLISYFYYNKPDSWSEMLPEPERFTDVPVSHPYAAEIDYLHKLQTLQDIAGGKSFEPSKPISRAEFIAAFIRMTGLGVSKNPVVFPDAVQDPYASFIQTATELGVVTGMPEHLFEPNRPITRQEAASLIWRITQGQFGTLPKQAKLSDNPAPWAKEGVHYVVATSMYGPETVTDTAGAIDYDSEKPMLRQEAAALLAKFSKNLLGM